MMQEVDFFIWALAGLTVMGAAGIQVLTGFGFSLLAIPLLLHLFPSREAILISMILSMFTLLLQSKKIKDDARWDLVWRLVIIGLPGLIFGVLVSDYIPLYNLKGLIGLILLGYLLFQWFNNRKIDDENKKISNSNENTPKGFYILGVLAGILTGMIGLPGPLVVIIFIDFLPRDIFRATLVFYFIVQYLMALILVFIFQNHFLSYDLFLITILLIIPTFIGFLIAFPLRKLINEKFFKKVVYSLLLWIGLYSSWEFIINHISLSLHL